MSSPVDCELCSSDRVKCLDAFYLVWECLECGAVFEEGIDVVDDEVPVRRPRNGPVEAAPKKWQRPRPKYEDSDEPV